MQDLPDIREQVMPYFEMVKEALRLNVKEGRNYAPVSILTTLTPFAQAELQQPETILIAPLWDNDEEREACLAKVVTFANKYAESLILSGSGRGRYSEFGDSEILHVFATMYMPGFNPWTYAQVFTVVEKEVIFDVACCSADNNLTSFFNLQGLWPDGKVPA